MKTYKFNKDTLLFEEDNRLIKYKKLFVLFLCCCIGISSVFIVFAAKKAETEIKLSEIISEKQQTIDRIKEPLREDNYIEDLYKAIGFNLNEKQYKTFSQLSLKYRKQIEDAKVPATLVWWICYKESGFNINAKNSTSSAHGFFQFVSGTYKSMCKLAGKNYNDKSEQTQVTIMLTYLNYLYNRNPSWEKVVDNYCGGKAHYPSNFLFK